MRRAIYNIINTTQPIDSILSVIAPDSCYGCGAKGSSLCDQCSEMTISPPPSRCFSCHKVTKNYVTCPSCKRILSVDSIIFAGPYDGVHKQLVMKMKKDASRSTARTLGSVLATLVKQSPYLAGCDIVVPVPTIAPHVRERGFDHASLITHELSKELGIPIFGALTRVHNTRQVGKSRKERFEQMKNGVKLVEVKSLNGVKNIDTSKKLFKGVSVLLVDDIATTGATLGVCAQVLKKAGAARVDAVVFASGN